MINALQRKNSQWASEMLDAQDAGLPIDVVDESGTAVFLVEHGNADVFGPQDLNPPPGPFERGGSMRRVPGAMNRLVDRQLGLPKTQFIAGGQLHQVQGVLAGARSEPFTITHLAGNRFMIRGGQIGDMVMPDQIVSVQTSMLLVLKPGLQVQLIPMGEGEDEVTITRTDFVERSGDDWVQTRMPWLAILRSGKSWKVQSASMAEDIANTLVLATFMPSWAGDFVE